MLKPSNLFYAIYDSCITIHVEFSMNRNRRGSVESVNSLLSRHVMFSHFPQDKRDCQSDILCATKNAKLSYGRVKECKYSNNILLHTCQTMT